MGKTKTRYVINKAAKYSSSMAEQVQKALKPSYQLKGIQSRTRGFISITNLQAYIGTGWTNNDAILSFITSPTLVNISLPPPYMKSPARAKLRTRVRRCIGIAVGLRQPWFTSFHAFSTCLLSSWYACCSETPCCFM